MGEQEEETPEMTESEAGSQGSVSVHTELPGS